MVARVARLLLLGVTVAALGLPAWAATPAYAATPSAIEITGTGTDQPVMLRPDTDPDLFSEVLGQVSWIAGRPAQTKGPAPETLGVKYTLVVLVKGKADQSYDLYPQAKGGPRVFRPARQPSGRKTTAGWFYGRLSMPDTLHAAGVPVPGMPAPPTGGAGAGEAQPTSPPADAPDLAMVFGQWRHVMLLNLAVASAVALALAGVSLLVRRP